CRLRRARPHGGDVGRHRARAAHGQWLSRADPHGGLALPALARLAALGDGDAPPRQRGAPAGAALVGRVGAVDCVLPPVLHVCLAVRHRSRSARRDLHPGALHGGGVRRPHRARRAPAGGRRDRGTRPRLLAPVGRVGGRDDGRGRTVRDAPPPRRRGVALVGEYMPALDPPLVAERPAASPAAMERLGPDFVLVNANYALRFEGDPVPDGRDLLLRLADGTLGYVEAFRYQAPVPVWALLQYEPVFRGRGDY